MSLKDGHAYQNAWGDRHMIGGTCADHPDWCWSTQGSWFVRATGQALRYDERKGEHYPAKENSWFTLTREVPV